MKKLFLLPLLLLAVAAEAQNALCHHFAPYANVYVYCIDHYALPNGEEAAVTLLTTGDSTTYRALCSEVHAMTYTPTEVDRYIVSDMLNLQSSATSASEGSHTSSTSAPYANPKKSIELTMVDGMAGETGRYLVCMPSDRMVILFFYTESVERSATLIRGILDTEFKR